MTYQMRVPFHGVDLWGGIFCDIGNFSGFPISQKALRAGCAPRGGEISRERHRSGAKNALCAFFLRLCWIRAAKGVCWGGMGRANRATCIPPCSGSGCKCFYMFWGREWGEDATAFNAPSVARFRLSPASMPPNCWGCQNMKKH